MSLSRPADQARFASALAAALVLGACGSEPGSSGVNAAPSAAITQPATNATFKGGDSISYAGAASDDEDGAEPASRLTWWAVLHHDTHTHPFMPRTTGSGGKLFVPPIGETSDNVFLRLYLEAVDDDGAADTVPRDILPQKAQITLATDPAGLSVTLDGQPVVAPQAITGVVGMERELGVTASQVLGATQYRFSTWSDGGAATHRIATPPTATTYTARFTPVVNQLPTAAITAPSGGATFTVNSTSSITATAGDADGTVSKVGFYDGTTLIGEDQAAPYAADWTPTATGLHVLTARATDNLDGFTTSAAVNVTVNASGNQALAATLTSPSAGDSITGSATFTVSVSGTVAVTAVDYQVDGETVGQATSSPWSFTLPSTSAYTSGVHVIRARARDAAGNLSGWSSARVTFGGSVNYPAGFNRTVYANELAWQGTAMAWDPDGRLFICEQGGAVRIVKDGVLLPTPFVTVPTTADGERGLLGIAFHPLFASNGWVYLYYTSAMGGKHNRISRFTASGDVAQPASETVLVDLPDLSAATNHNGGALHFGPDGKLYVAVGENATPSNAPSLNSVLGKLLRFNDDGTIPPGNPFDDGRTTGLNRSIWALGLRNPFTFAFEPGTGLMYINDVGQNSWEEINVGRAGADYGWPATEGATTAAGIDSPLFTYSHGANSTLVTGMAIVGGAFYRPSSVMFPPAWVGNYFFGDYVAGWVNRLDTSNGNEVYAFARLEHLTDIQVGPDGALYVLALVDGAHWGVIRYGR